MLIQLAVGHAQGRKSIFKDVKINSILDSNPKSKEMINDLRRYRTCRTVIKK